MSDSASFVALRYRVRPAQEAWVLPEGTVPESTFHDRTAEQIRAVLDAWTDRVGRPVRIARNLATRWLEQAPRIGIDPDVCVLDPPPPEEDVGSLCVWKPGHPPPTICFEVVSPNHPHKDYRDVHERYAALGTQELVVFDPLLAGPSSFGGPWLFQLWRTDALGTFERVKTGDGPVFSEVLSCWLSAEQRTLVFSDDRAGAQRWLTREERLRADGERERAEKERALRAGRELNARLEALERRFGKDGGG